MPKLPSNGLMLRAGEATALIGSAMSLYSEFGPDQTSRKFKGSKSASMVGKLAGQIITDKNGKQTKYIGNEKHNITIMKNYKQ